MPKYFFNTVEDYLRATNGGADLPFMPVSLAAEHLKITPAGVTARLAKDALDEVKIGKLRFVGCMALWDAQQDFMSKVETVEGYLIDLARQGETRVFYDPPMRLIGLDHHKAADRTMIGRTLGKVSERSIERPETEGLMLSVLVHNKTAGDTLPGSGFFDLARHFDLMGDESPEDFVAQQTQELLDAYA